MPTELRIVDKELDPLLVTLRGEHADYIFSVGRARHDVPVGQLRIEHRKPVMMFRRNGDVLHPGRFGQRDPRRGIKFDGIEEIGELCVIGAIDGPCFHDPLPVAEDAVDAPMNEHAELRVLEPCARLQALRRGSVSLLSAC